MNDNFSHEIRNLCSDYSGIVTSCGAFSGNEAASISRSITDEVMPLLNFEKPKILVYGVYNGGKSTLVNALCGKEIAEVADRPMTYKTAEYDIGKYILVDSPGIDAPQEHEEIADSYINSCHVILFVISSKGGFESKVNYRKMLSIIEKNLPFIIVLNERGVPTNEQEQHLIEMNDIKRKVIENLIKESGRKDIGSKYDVIVLDARRAWKGVSENNPKFINASHISDLKNRIDQLLEGKEAMKSLLAPLSALERKIGDGEKILISKNANNDYAMKRETLHQKISQFSENFMEDLRFLGERHFDEIYQGFIGSSRINIPKIYDNICQEAEEVYKRSSQPIINYIRNNFSDLNVVVDNQGRVTLNAPSKNNSENQSYSENSNLENLNNFSENEDEGSFADDISVSKISAAATAGAAAGAAIGSFVPVLGTALGGAGGALLGGAAEFFRQIFESSELREAKEYERRKREVEAYNRLAEQKAEEENRRRQDARIAATNQINSIIRDLRNSYSNIIDKNFAGVIQIIDNAIARISKNNTNITKTLGTLKQLRERINILRREISC